MKVLSLFSGGGLGDYGLELAGMEIVGQVEIDEYCQKILSLRWPNVPKFKDVRSVNKDTLPECDIISGGFPCQDISYAGLGVGISGERSGLWKEMLRIICEIRPKFVLVENVTALLGRGLGVVLGDLADAGYDAEWTCLSASAFSAPHKRERVWIVAYPNSPNVERRIFEKKSYGEPLGTIHVPISWRKWPELLSTPILCRADDGIANRMDRTKLLGNGQVVQVVEWIGKIIMQFNKQENRWIGKGSR